MDKLNQLLEECISEELKKIVLSGVKDKNISRKIQIRPILVGDQLLFQAAEYKENKVFHYNYEKEAAIRQITAWISQDFRQMQVTTSRFQVSVLSSKKGRITIGKKKVTACAAPVSLAHNRKKTYILEEGKGIPFLVDLGVMTPEGQVKKGKYDKFRQINRFLEFIRDVLPKLDKKKVLRVIDFGCGKSYLTFAMYYYLKEMNGYEVEMTGLDLKEDVIKHCNDLAERYGYTELKFLNGDIATYDGADRVDLVVTLHACDTATDYALAKAIGWGAQVILSVPCCQHELNGQIHSEVLAPVLQYGLLKERMAALLTDGIRAELLESAGYAVQVLEFIDMEHTPKNILIRAVKKADPASRDQGRERQEAQLRQLCEFLNAQPMLDKLMREGEDR